MLITPSKAAVFGSLLLALIPAARAQQGGWTGRPDAPTARIRASAVPLNGKLYVVGGKATFQSSSALPQLEAYDPLTNAWTQKATVDFGGQPRDNIQAVSADGHIYAFAMASTGTYAYGARWYDEASNTWFSGGASPDYYYSGGNFRPVTIGAKIYIFSGKSNGDKYPYTYIDMYDLATHNWTLNAPGSGQVLWYDDAAYGYIGGKVYIAGGTYIGMATTNRLVEFNPVTTTWTTKANLPNNTTAAGYAVLNDRLFVTGGANTVFGGFGPATLAYDPTADSWSTQTSMNTSRYGLYDAEVGGRIYALGGVLSNNAAQFTVEEYSLNAGQVRLRSRWLSTNLHEENKTGFVQNGSAPAFWWSSQWTLETSPQGWVRIRNRWTGDYMHIENLTGKVQAGPIQDVWDSAKWWPETWGAYKRFRNVWNGQYIHIENNNGFAQYGPVNDAWESAQWAVDLVP